METELERSKGKGPRTVMSDKSLCQTSDSQA